MTETDPQPPEQKPELSEDEFSRRKDLRIPLRVIRVEASETRKSEVFFGYASNLSKSGLFIQTTNPKEVGTKVKLRFILPPHKEQISCEAEVMWAKIYSGSGSSPGMGMRFIQIADDARATIERFIETMNTTA